jgi:hypothetical protein
MTVVMVVVMVVVMAVVVLMAAMVLAVAFVVFATAAVYKGLRRTRCARAHDAWG